MFQNVHIHGRSFSNKAHHERKQPNMTKVTLYKSLVSLRVNNQDTQSCVMRPSSGAQDTVCYLLEPTFSRFQPFITQKLQGRF